MDNTRERIFGRRFGERATLRQFLRAEQALDVGLGENASLDAVIALHELEVLAPVQAAIVKNKARKEMLHHEIVQDHDAGVLLAEMPDRVMITRVVPHLVKRRVGLVDLAPRWTLPIVMANRRASWGIEFP